ncbi:hypothetical protein GOQ27_13375 [Clostridium sp. D2Q-11]|uniref:Uncharacterized protein n=1 Tax=Anaeromonas frigoriresistens TaxID=2683708 RepID=A0A942V049_9FIRM|nr:hypothetical protein [Anaeromonas frigoriresistens]MBS4539461.1 hypothetical protein [Anaeromonas frigoriresistens]
MAPVANKVVGIELVEEAVEKARDNAVLNNLDNCEFIADFNSPRLLYVYCKTTSLVEDLQEFKELGYEVKKVKCMDMFPHTPHVECCVLLKRITK